MVLNKYVIRYGCNAAFNIIISMMSDKGSKEFAKEVSEQSVYAVVVLNKQPITAFRKGEEIEVKKAPIRLVRGY